MTVESLPDEKWRPVPGYEGRYEVSDDGQVRALPGPGTGRVDQVRLLKPYRARGGYLEVALYSGDGKRGRSHRGVHSLILEAFVGPRPDGKFALHADDDPNNNTLPNLRWGTYSENGLDKVRNGNHHNARKTHCRWGHPYEGDNLILTSKQRACRACHRQRSAEWARRAAQTRSKERS
jgi:hypothetical protein